LILLQRILSTREQSCAMKIHRTLLKQRPVKALAVVGVGAVVTLGALSAAYGGIEIRPGPILAKSGDKTNPVPTQPAVGQMDFGGDGNVDNAKYRAAGHDSQAAGPKLTLPNRSLGPPTLWKPESGPTGPY
jgi:hypothetical protein